VKFTQYFLSTRLRDDRKDIQLEWIERVKNHPLRRVIQQDGRIRLWGMISVSGEDRYLRVVLLEDGETIHNVFFDRGFKL
jgi:hypothetical protein